MVITETPSQQTVFWEQWYGILLAIIILFGLLTLVMIGLGYVLFSVLGMHPIIGMLILMGSLPIVICAYLPLSIVMYRVLVGKPRQGRLHPTKD